jgi:hypothetical protein
MTSIWNIQKVISYERIFGPDLVLHQTQQTGYFQVLMANINAWTGYINMQAENDKTMKWNNINVYTRD